MAISCTKVNVSLRFRVLVEIKGESPLEIGHGHQLYQSQYVSYFSCDRRISEAYTQLIYNWE